MTRRAALLLAAGGFCLGLGLFGAGYLMYRPEMERHGSRRPSWGDSDRDCQNTRAEVIIRDSSWVEYSPGRGCKVAKAVLVDLYSGAEITTDTVSQSVQVDHLFPQSVARERWPGPRLPSATYPFAFEDFYNDEDNLQAVRSRTNRQKGARMPQEWCPFNVAARPVLAKRFRAVASTYGLPLTRSELAGLSFWDAGLCAPGSLLVGGGR